MVKKPYVSTLILLRESEHLASYDHLAGILQLNEETEVEFPTLYPEDEIVIFTTFGSTGKPKMVPKTHLHVTNLNVNTTQKYYNDRPFAWGLGSPIANVFFGSTQSILRFLSCHRGTQHNQNMGNNQRRKVHNGSTNALFPLRPRGFRRKLQRFFQTECDCNKWATG
jgi:acyl-CoA synthetase (AMP-forming)/AMP-acid ligase II